MAALARQYPEPPHFVGLADEQPLASIDGEGAAQFLTPSAVRRQACPPTRRMRRASRGALTHDRARRRRPILGTHAGQTEVDDRRADDRPHFGQAAVRSGRSSAPQT